jgi:hypothetical protein
MTATLALSSLVVAAVAAPPTEYEVKAAYLYNFLKFVEWPADRAAAAAGPFCIAVVGADPFGPLLDKTVASKEIRGRPVTIRRVGEPKAALGCHVIFFGRIHDVPTTKTLRALAGTGALTVGDQPGFAQKGGMVNFVLDADSVGFEINPAAAAREGLTLSPRLLQLARIIPEDGP